MRVLIPLDGSPFSEQIMPYVSHFFDPEQVEITVFRVTREPEMVANQPLAEQRPLPPTPPPPLIRGTQTSHALEVEHTQLERPGPEDAMVSPSRIEESVRNEVKDALMETAVPLREAGFNVKAAVGFGDPAESIARHVEDEDIDLICMTTHGRSGLSRLLFGSVAEEVLRNIRVPLMVLHPVEDDDAGE